MANPRYGSFVPTTNVWDVSDIASVDVNSDAFKELLVRIYQNINIISLVLNQKITGYYPTVEFPSAERYFPKPGMIGPQNQFRDGFLILIDFGALPNAGTKSVPHGLSTQEPWTFTQIYGCATQNTTPPFSYIPLPYASPTLNKNIELSVDDMNVNVTTAIDYSAYTTTYIVLKYLKT